MIRTLYSGWKGFFASGADRTVRVPSLAAFRSTWNGTDECSQEILIPGRARGSWTRRCLEDLARFLPGRETALKRAALPRPYLKAKTIGAFAPPTIPVPLVDFPASPPSRGDRWFTTSRTQSP